MSKKKGSGTALATVLVILVIFAALTFAAIEYFIPLYHVTQRDVYSWAVKVFPLLVGLTLIVIASALGKDDKTEEEEDKLPSNSDEKLSTKTPLDGQEKTTAQPIVQDQQPEPAPFVSIFDIEPTEEEAEEKAPEEAEETDAAVESEESEEVEEAEEPEEVNEEVEPEASAEQPVEQTAEQPVTQPVTIVVDASANQTYKNYEGSAVRQAVEAEYDSAKDFKYDLNIANVSAKCEDVALQLGDFGKCIANNDNTIVVIPFANESEAKEALDKLNLPFEIRSMETESNVSFDDLIKGWID